MRVLIEVDLGSFDLERFESWIKAHAEVVKFTTLASEDQKVFAYNLIETASNISQNEINEYMERIGEADGNQISEIIDELKGLQSEKVASQKQINNELDEALRRL